MTGKRKSPFTISLIQGQHEDHVTRHMSEEESAETWWWGINKIVEA
jgi:hypothetical protein